MLAKMLKRFQAQRNCAVENPSISNTAVSLWKDTGQVYYLENTLKLTYQSCAGKITIEKLSMTSLAQVLAELQALDTVSTLAQKETANQVDAYSVSVCGVTWQTADNGQSIRIKALPEAATLRSPTACFTKSQAIFKHAFMLEHDDLLTPASLSKPGIFTYNRISLNDFISQLALANEKLANGQKATVSVGHQNFETAFTDHEQSIIEQFIKHDETVFNKDGRQRLLTDKG
ncbi:hypothetical protein [Alteromonas macleodii]|uniref:hypothetical protein n=1 Tax=Alteromonas macleodii TaxID=28108 RepID=UPI001E293773|nr:hypothetical protein [Alteromonas macleodii]